MQCLFFGGGDEVFHFSTQEEADTRIILQSMFINQQMVKRNSNGRIVIKSSPLKRLNQIKQNLAGMVPG
jgi:anthranilate/para-aminobenzoate synthase component I